MENQPKVKPESWIKGLDSIRFILALIVFLSHLDNPFHEVLIRSPHLIVRMIGMVVGVLFSGVGSVMAFFIISGFVIHYPNKDKYPETTSFLVRRWLRIGLPLLAISLIASLVHQFSVIPVWSLYCELIYYSLYPLIIRLPGNWKNKFWISFGFAFVLIILSSPEDRASLIHQKNINYIGAYWQLGSFLTWIVGLPCWLLGVLLAQNIDSYRENVSTGQIYFFRFLVLTTGILLDVLKFHFFCSYFYTMNLFAFLLFVWIKKEILYFKDRKPVCLLEFSGKFSYSLYLCHNVFAFFISSIFPLTVYSYFPTIFLVLLTSYFFLPGYRKALP